MVVVGFSTNIARLLDSAPDKHSPLSGKELVAKKCRLLSIMAGHYGEKPTPEYNVFIDVPAARKVYAEWPTAIVASGFEIGLAIKFPAVSIEHDFNYVAHHPLPEAYALYQKMPYDRETWDLTSVLNAVRPDRGYFTLSDPGTITIDEKNVTHFAPFGSRSAPISEGRRRTDRSGARGLGQSCQPAAGGSRRAEALMLLRLCISNDLA